MAKKEETESAAPVTVTANCDLMEAGTRYAKGDTFQTTAERASALGDHVTPA